MNILRTEGLYKTYNEGSENEVHALKPLDISIEGGLFYAIIGRSGSG
ncbi:MAG: ABC transporter ATP-binding protein, partial [Ruminococcaceae bacterium]|nr:ABC transporter ATP-binding protein [Oscillospiraceae bacterium]